MTSLLKNLALLIASVVFALLAGELLARLFVSSSPQTISLPKDETAFMRLIEEGKNGLLCNPADEADLADKIGALLSSDLKALGAHSRHMVESRFAWPQIARRTAAAYESVL